MADKKSVTMVQCMENIQTYIRKPENLQLIDRAYQLLLKHMTGSSESLGNPM